jgi:hypothetical protein
MGTRYQTALRALHVVDLLILSQVLKGVVEECVQESVDPYKDIAVKLVSWQIAYTTNADIQFSQFWEKVLSFAQSMAELEEHGLPTKEEMKDAPIYKAS